MGQYLYLGMPELVLVTDSDSDYSGPEHSYQISNIPVAHNHTANVCDTIRFKRKCHFNRYSTNNDDDDDKDGYAADVSDMYQCVDAGVMLNDDDEDDDYGDYDDDNCENDGDNDDDNGDDDNYNDSGGSDGNDDDDDYGDNDEDEDDDTGNNNQNNDDDDDEDDADDDDDDEGDGEDSSDINIDEGAVFPDDFQTVKLLKDTQIQSYTTNIH